MKSPCYQCPNREAKCHSSCTKYKAWKAERDEERKEYDKHHVSIDTHTNGTFFGTPYRKGGWR